MKMIYLSYPIDIEKALEEMTHSDFQRRHIEIDTFVENVGDIYPDTLIVNAARVKYQLYHNTMCEVRQLLQCFELMSRCDEVWFAPNWTNSQTCIAEYSYVVGRNMKVKLVDDMGKLLPIHYA